MANGSFSGSVLSSSATAGVGYATGAGGTVTQATSKSTGVTLNKIVGQITTTNASLGGSTTVTFTVTNSACAATDFVQPFLVSGNATPGTYEVWVEAIAAGSFKINIRNITLTALGEALVIGFGILKGVTS